MNKQEFLKELRSHLEGLPEKDIEERVSFYSEIIDDRVSEEKITEEDAVSHVGSPEKIASQIIVETSFYKLAKEKVKAKGGLKWWGILAIILGFPIWFSVLVAVFSVVLAIYICFGSVIVALWAVFAAVLGSGLGVTALGITNLFTGSPLEGAAMIGAGIACVGFSILVFYGCRAVTKGFAWVNRKIVFLIKNSIRKGGEA